MRLTIERLRSLSVWSRGRRKAVRLAQLPRRLPLFPSVLGVVTVAVVVAVTAFWGFGELLLGVSPFIHRSDTSIHPQDVIKLALTVAAGFGGIVALTVAYRRQREAESGRFGQRFADSAAQLGGTSAAVRMAGAYAMAALTDETNGTGRRQQCIDVLCAYLRLPYHSGNHSDLLEQVVTTDTTVALGGQTHNDQRTYRLQPQEREVRLTIVGIIRDHMQERATIGWHGHRFDFSGATFDGGSFTGAKFSGGTVNFRGAMFSGCVVDFRGVMFSGCVVDFGGATFSGDVTVDFGGAKFSGGAVNFGGATFSGDVTVDFRDATFSGGLVHFGGAKFSGGAVAFTGATFSGGTVNFRRATFSGGLVDFGGAMFSDGLVLFEGATFSGGLVLFVGAKFSGGLVLLGGATFSGGLVDFEGATFSGGVVDLRRVSNWSCPPINFPDDQEGLGLPVVWAADWSHLPDLVARPRRPFVPQAKAGSGS